MVKVFSVLVIGVFIKVNYFCLATQKNLKNKFGDTNMYVYVCSGNKHF